MNNDLLALELGRLATEARAHARGKRPDVALLRLASSLMGLTRSLSKTTLTDSPFTIREKEILFHVSQGFTNRDIAAALDVSEKTIEFHVNSILKKTESASRAEAVANAFKNKWLS
jgi:DNA-binding NarL/FixJ family response regulator